MLMRVSQDGSRLARSPTQYAPQWLPTDLQQAGGERVVLREALHVHESCAYVIWPLAAKRLLAALPLHSTVDDFISRQLVTNTVRLLVSSPMLAARRAEHFVPPVPVTRYRVTHQPRVAVRTTPNPNGFIDGAKQAGDVVYATEHSADGQWARIGEKAWVMLSHEKFGPLLEKLEDDAEDS
jgi:hypothetical protein